MKKGWENLCGSSLFKAPCLWLVFCALLAQPLSVSAAGITWRNPATINGDPDVYTNGELVYAFGSSGTSATVNTVSFAGNFSGQVSVSGSSGTVGSSFAGGSSAPWSGLSSNYQTVLKGGVYANTNTSLTVTLNNLAIGSNVLVQLWVNDSRSGTTAARTEFVTNAGGNTVTFAYNSTQAQGGVGQYALGTFTADAVTQSFTLTGVLPSGGNSSQINAIQVRYLSVPIPTNSVVINYSNTCQRIDGFGASSAWMSSALSSADADLLFSTNTGAGLSLLRTRIAPGGVIDDAEGTIAQEAQARGARVWSTPWTPPAALKITNSWGTNAPLNGGFFSNTVANCKIYAADLANYVGIMKNSYSVNLYAVSVQNEPTEFVDYESCEWTSQDIHDFVTNFSAALTASNFNTTKIMLPENYNWSWSLATNTMNDTITSNLVGILACHNYGSSASPVTQFGTPCPKTLWETEHYLGTGDDITNGLEVAQEIHSFLTVAQVNAYHYWWLTGSGTGSIADNTANPAKRLFVLGNYSRFIRPNYYRIAADNNSAALISAYIDPVSSNFTIVAANPNSFSINQTFTLTNFPVVGPLREWVTSATESLGNQGGAVAVANGTFAVALPPMTVTTFVYQSPVTNRPTILQQPVSQVTNPGGAVSLALQAAGGTIPLYYQWLFNGTNIIPGATNATLSVDNVAATNAGNYSVVVTNYAGSVTSDVATLGLNTLVWGTLVTISETNDIATNGILLYAYNDSGGSARVNGVTFTGVNSYSAWGSGVTLGAGWSATSTSSFGGGSSAPWSNLAPTYQTILEGGALNNGGPATVTLNNLMAGHQYQVQVWVNDSRAGGSTNRTETLTDAYDNSVTLAYNSTKAGGGLGQFSIGAFTASATTQSFTMNGAASTQLNALQVRDITVYAPAITQQPTNATAYVNASTAFTVAATGSAPLNYQWFFNTNSLIAGATNANLPLTALAVTNGGTYSVVITNVAGSITSAIVTLTVLPLPLPIINSVWLSGTNLIFAGTNGASAGNLFYTLATTNLALPLTNWTFVATNFFGAGGGFTVTNAVDPQLPQSFFILQVP